MNDRQQERRPHDPQLHPLLQELVVRPPSVGIPSRGGAHLGEPTRADPTGLRRDDLQGLVPQNQPSLASGHEPGTCPPRVDSSHPRRSCPTSTTANSVAATDDRQARPTGAEPREQRDRDQRQAHAGGRRIGRRHDRERDGREDGRYPHPPMRLRRSHHEGGDRRQREEGTGGVAVPERTLERPATDQRSRCQDDDPRGHDGQRDDGSVDPAEETPDHQRRPQHPRSSAAMGPALPPFLAPATVAPTHSSRSSAPTPSTTRRRRPRSFTREHAGAPAAPDASTASASSSPAVSRSGPGTTGTAAPVAGRAVRSSRSSNRPR